MNSLRLAITLILTIPCALYTMSPENQQQVLNDKLMHALHDNYTKRVREFVAQGANVNFVSGICGYTPLHLARGALVQFLLERGASLQARLTGGKHAGLTPLELALERGKRDHDHGSKAKKLISYMQKHGIPVPQSAELQLSQLSKRTRATKSSGLAPAKRKQSTRSQESNSSTVITLTIPVLPAESLPPLPIVPALPTSASSQNLDLRKTSDSVPMPSVSSWLSLTSENLQEIAQGPSIFAE